MPKVVITEKGQAELTFLNFDVEKAIFQILKKLSLGDIVGIGHIYVTDLPTKIVSNSTDTSGAYFKKFNDRPAYIEIYLKNLFRHIKGTESMNLMLPIQSQGLAHVIFHEVGHHVKHTKSHGINKSKSESFAETYAKQHFNRYIIDNTAEINACFDNLDKIADERGLSKDIINNMRDGWEKQYQAAVRMSELIKSGHPYHATSPDAKKLGTASEIPKARGIISTRW